MKTIDFIPYDKAKLTKAQRWQIADLLAEDLLQSVNSLAVPVSPRKSIYSKYIKRILDIILSLPAVIITLPINAIIGIVTFFDVGSPVFFTHKRIGKNGKIFTLYKFRNMTNETDESGELLPPNKRVTKWGRFVRKTSLDELLNFIAILKGDMSFIGPRPLPTEYAHRYNDRHKTRHEVRPGLECPPYKHTDHVSSWQEQLENDIWYIENVSFKTDCVLMLRLIQLVFNKNNTDERTTVKQRGPFMGYNENGTAIDLSGVPEEYIAKVVRIEEEQDDACQ